MIKRIIACLTICLIITGLISPVFSDASALPQPNWSDPGISELINISDLTGWVMNGGVFDVSTYTDSESFMNDYFNARVSTKLVNPDDPINEYYEVLPGFGVVDGLYPNDDFYFADPNNINRVISSSFRQHTGYGRRFSEQVNKSLLNNGSLNNTLIPLLNELEFANFIGYNHSALGLYKDYFVTDGPTVNPDINYNSYIDTINGSGFYWKSYSNLNYYESGPGLLIYPPDTLSWFSYGANKIIDANHIPTIASTHILNIYIVKETDNSYSFDLTIPISDFLYNFIYRNNSYRLGQIYDNGTFAFLSAAPNNAIYHINGTLTDVFNYIKDYFRNVNIYVDNTPWSLISDSRPTLTPEFPDAVGGEDLPSTTWPVYRPLAPYYITVPGMLQAIDNAILDDGKLDIDDLKPYLTDANGDTVTDPDFDPEPVPIPVPDPVNPDIVPGLPILPAIPPEMPGFNGVSVLAEIINFTNQSLPDALIVTFWGIIFGIVILGLIKILHK